MNEILFVLLKLGQDMELQRHQQQQQQQQQQQRQRLQQQEHPYCHRDDSQPQRQRRAAQLFPEQQNEEDLSSVNESEDLLEEQKEKVIENLVDEKQKTSAGIGGATRWRSSDISSGPDTRANASAAGVVREVTNVEHPKSSVAELPRCLDTSDVRDPSDGLLLSRENVEHQSTEPPSSAGNGRAETHHSERAHQDTGEKAFPAAAASSSFSPSNNSVDVEEETSAAKLAKKGEDEVAQAIQPTVSESGGNDHDNNNGNEDHNEDDDDDDFGTSPKMLTATMRYGGTNGTATGGSVSNSGRLTSRDGHEFSAASFTAEEIVAAAAAAAAASMDVAMIGSSSNISGRNSNGSGGGGGGVGPHGSPNGGGGSGGTGAMCSTRAAGGSGGHWKDAFRVHKSLSVDDSGVFCSTPSSDESHSPTHKSPSPTSFSSSSPTNVNADAHLLANQYQSPISGDRRGSASSVYSQYREASQKRYCGLLMSMLEPSSEPKPKLKGLVLPTKSAPPAPSSSKVLPVIVTNPTVAAKAERVPAVVNKAERARSAHGSAAAAAAAAVRAPLEQRSSAPTLSSAFRKTFGFSEANEWDTPSRPAPPLPENGCAPQDVAEPKGELIERYLSSYSSAGQDSSRNVHDDPCDSSRIRNGRSGSLANIAAIKDADVFARSSIGETRSKWQSMEFQSGPSSLGSTAAANGSPVGSPPLGPPPIPPRPASRQQMDNGNSRTGSSGYFNSSATGMKAAKSEASLACLTQSSNGYVEIDGTPGPQNFRALAAKWEQRSAQDTGGPPIPARKLSDPRPPLGPAPKPASRVSIMQNGCTFSGTNNGSGSSSSSSSSNTTSGSERGCMMTMAMLGMADSSSPPPPTSTPPAMAPPQLGPPPVAPPLGVAVSPAVSPIPPAVLSSAPVRPAPRGTSDLKKTFDEVQRPLKVVEHRRFSSIDSNDSGNSSTSNREQYSSLTSLASTSSSIISPQDLQQLIDDANQALAEEEGGRVEAHDLYVVVLHKDSPTSGAGITLAGGSDYESKEITVHKVITGSAADRDGRIRRSDRVLSINGRPLKGATHREALDILKSPRPEVVLVLSREPSGRASSGARSAGNLSRASSVSSVLDVIDEPVACDAALPTFEGAIVIVLEKDKVGLGFTLQGGKDSPLGNRALTINRIFSCGAAERDGRLQPGDELLAINQTVTTNMTRTEAWNFLKKLPEGRIAFTVRQGQQQQQQQQQHQQQLQSARS